MQEFEVIEGILDVGKGAVLSVCRAVQNGLIDHCTGLSLLQAQLVTSELILPEFHMCLDLEDAFKHNLVDEPMYKQLRDLNEANKCIQSPRYASEPLPTVAAVRDGAISERLAVKMIEIQLATGGLRVTCTEDSLSLERAFEFGLIPQSLYIQILQRQNTWKDLIDPNTAEKVSLIQLVQRSILHEETGLRLLAVKSGKDGSIGCTSGREVGILKARYEGLIDRETMLRLLSAQVFAGGIVDPRTNRKLTVEEAVSDGLIDQDTASGILSHQAQNGGIVNPKTGARLTVDEAVQCGLMSSRSALLVLERQKCFMGFLWPHSGEILTVPMSIQHEIITEKLAHELLCNRHKIAAFYIPENSEVVDIDLAAQNGFINACTVDFLKTIEIPDMFPEVEDLNDRFSSWLVMRELQIEGSERSREELEANEKGINSPSSLEAKQLFVSFLMMNSYMDPRSGQRLLIFDRQFNKMTKVLLEMSETDTHVNIHDSFQDEDFPDDEQITQTDELVILHIDEPLPRIEKEIISEFSLKDDHWIKISTTESDNPISGSGEINNTSLGIVQDKAPASEIKTHKSTPQDTFTDSTISFVQPSVGAHVSQRFNAEIVTQTNSLCTVEKNEPLTHRENSLQAKDDEPTQCPVLCSKKAQNFNLSTECTQCDGVYDSKLERDRVLCLLSDQVNDGGVLDVTSGKRYNLDDAFKKGLIDEQTVLDVLELQLGKSSVINRSVIMSVLKQAVSQSYISSHLALQIMQQQNLHGDFCDSSGKPITTKEAWERGLITDDSSSLVLDDSELTQKATTDPDGSASKTVCENEADNDEILVVDLGKKCTENNVSRSEEDTDLLTNSKQMTSSLESSFTLNADHNEEIIAEEFRGMCPSTENLLAASAQMTSGLKTLSGDEITAQDKHGLEIPSVDFSEKRPSAENAGNIKEELSNSNQITSSLDSSFVSDAVSYEEIAAEEFAENALSTENAKKKSDEVTNVLATKTEMTNTLDSLFTVKLAGNEEVVAKEFGHTCPSTEYGLIGTAEINALVTDLTQFTSSSASSLKTVTGEGITDEEFDEKCPNTENELKGTEQASNLLATQSVQMTDSLGTSKTLKAASEKDTSGDFSNKGLNTKMAIKTPEEDNYLSANSAQIKSNLVTPFSFNAVNDEIFYEELKEKCPSTESLVKSPDDAHLSTNSKRITTDLDSPFLLKAGSDVKITALKKESFEMPAVDFNEKCQSIDNTVNRTEEDTHLSASSKQIINSLDLEFTLNTISNEPTGEKTGEKSPSTENAIKKADKVSNLLPASTQLTSNLDSSFTTNATVDISIEGKFGEMYPGIANKAEGSEEDTNPVIHPTPMPSSLNPLFSTKVSNAPAEGSTETEMETAEQTNPSLINPAQVSSILNSTLLLPSVSECPSTESSLNSSFTLKITNEEFAEKCPSADDAVEIINKVSQVLIVSDEVTMEKLDKKCQDTENELKELEEATNTTRGTYSLDSSLTTKTAEIFIDKSTTTDNAKKRTGGDTPSLMRSSLETSSTLKNVSEEVTEDIFDEKILSRENSLRTNEGTRSTNLTQTTSSLDSLFTQITDNREICAEDLSKKCPSTKNAVNRTEEVTASSINTARVQVTNKLDSTFTPKTESTEIFVKDRPSNENAFNRTEEASPQLTTLAQIVSTLDSTLNKEVTNDVLGEKCPSEISLRTSDEASLPAHLIQTTNGLKLSLTSMTDSDEIPAEDLSTEKALNKTEDANPLLMTSAQMISTLDSLFTLKTDSEGAIDDAFGKKCPSINNSVSTSDEASLSTNLPHTASTFSSFPIITESKGIPAEESSQITENAVNRTPLLTSAQITSSLDSFTLNPFSDEITEKSPGIENEVNSTGKETPPSSSTQMNSCSDSSSISKIISDEITDQLLYDKCPSPEIEFKGIIETNCLIEETKNAVSRAEETTPLLNNSTQRKNTLDLRPANKVISDKELDKNSPCTENVMKRMDVIPSATEKQNEVKRIIHTHGLEDLNNSDYLDSSYSRNTVESKLGNVPEKENEHNEEASYDSAFNALWQSPLCNERDVASNEAAVNQRRSSLHRDSGISCLLPGDIHSDERKSESLVNIHKPHNAFNKPQQTASSTPSEKGSERLNAVEDIKILTGCEPSLSSSTLLHLSEMKAAGITNMSPESSENMHDRRDSELSQSVDCLLQTNMNERDLIRCTINKTSVTVEQPNYECKSGTVTSQTVDTQSSHIGASVDKTVWDFDLVSVDSLESLDMSKLCSGDTPKTSPTLKFVPDVSLSDDSNNEHHLSKQNGEPDSAIDSRMPNSGVVLPVKNSYDTESLQYKPGMHVAGEQSLKSATSNCTISSDLVLNAHVPQDFNNNGDEPCAKSLVTKSRLENDAVKGAVKEIRSKERQGLDNKESISPTSATQHYSNVIQDYVESKDPGVLKNLIKPDEILNQEKCPSNVTGHGQAPDSLVLMQAQLPGMIQQMSAYKDSGVLGIPSQRDQGSSVEGIEVHLRAAASDGCDDGGFQSALSNQLLSKANGSSIEEVKDVKASPGVRGFNLIYILNLDNTINSYIMIIILEHVADIFHPTLLGKCR